VDSKATLTRLFLGLGIGVFCSVVLGVCMGCFRIVERFFSPPLLLLSKVPPTAMLAVFFVMAGTGMEMYLAMIGFGTLPTLAQTIFLAVKDVPRENIDKARTLGASTCEVVWDVIFKQILPRIIDNIRMQIGPSMVYLIAAEMVCGDVGFGYRIRTQSRLLNMNVVYPYLVLLGCFGFGMDWVLRCAMRRMCRWYTAGAGR
jgi:NitT/TauT family transport system permease protein